MEWARLCPLRRRNRAVPSGSAFWILSPYHFTPPCGGHKQCLCERTDKTFAQYAHGACTLFKARTLRDETRNRGST